MMQIRERLKFLLPKIAISIFAFLFIFVVLEVTLRILKIQSDNFIMQDAVLGWTHIPDKTGYSISQEFKVKRRINKDGFIGRNYDYFKNPGIYRMVVAGDSMTEAFQMEESKTYSALIESKSADFLGKKVEALNMGMAGIGTQKETYILETKGLKFDPDLLVMAFFVGNDFYDNTKEKVNLGAEFTEFRKLKNNIKLFFRSNSAVWRFILNKKSKNIFLKSINSKNNPAAAANTAVDPVFLEEYSTETQDMVQNTEELLLKFKNTADRAGKDNLVLILPSASQVYPHTITNEVKNRPKGDHSFGVGVNFDKKPDSDPEKINKILGDFFKVEKINYIDLLPDFKNSYKLNPDKPLYFPVDGHMNERAHSIVADKVLNYLKNKSWKY